MGIEYLQGKSGAGLRAVWIGEKTCTSFAVYVYVRNITATAYNVINGTSLSGNIGLDKTASVNVSVTNVTTGKVESSVITSLTNDPLVWQDASGNPLASSNWSGLRVRRFHFTGLQPGKAYTIRPLTDAVTANDLPNGKVATFDFQVKTLSAGHISGFSWGCDLNRWNTGLDNDALGAGEGTWFRWLDKILAKGNDIAVCADDPHYLTSGGLIYHNNYADPISLTSDTVSAALGRYYGSKLADCELNVEEAIVGSYDDAYALIGEFFSVLLQPACLATAMQSSLEMIDGGDHLALPNNSNICVGDAGLEDAFLVTYDADGDTDYFASGGANFLTDLETMATMNLNYMLMMEYLFGRAIGTQTESTGNTFIRAMLDTTVTGQGKPTIDPFITYPLWRKREHPIADLFYLNCTNYSDVASAGGQTGSAPYPMATDRTENKTLGDTQRNWLVTQITNSTKDFIVVFIGDPLQMVDENLVNLGVTDAAGDNGIYGQNDSIGQKSRSERDALMSSLDAIGKPILVLTCDHHAAAMSADHANIVQVVCVGLHSGARRLFSNSEGRFTGQYTALDRGFSRFVITEKRMSAYSVTIDDAQGNPLGTDIAYVEAGSSVWQFSSRSRHKYANTAALGSGLANLETM